jgi:hypothetical protein
VSKGPRGVRLNPQQDERTRSAIQTTQIVKRLTKLVNGEVEMPPHAVTAALGLLRKTLPDLTSTELTGEVTTTKVIRTPAVANNLDTWQRQYGDKPKELN